MQKFKTFLTVIGAVTILVLAANSAVYAATGGKFILGQTNKAGKQTVLKRTKAGPALGLTTKSSATAPFTTNGTGRVANLNADKVDGFDSSSMLNSTLSFTKSISLGAPGTSFGLTTSTVPAGTYLVTGSAWVYGPTTGAGFECSIQGSGSSTARWSWVNGNSDGFYTPNMVGQITLNAAQTAVFECHGGPSFAWNTFSGSPMQLTMTRVASPVTGSATRTAPRVGRVGPAAR
jgi:hypothetical protein